MAKLPCGRGAQTHTTRDVRSAPANLYGSSPMTMVGPIHAPMSDVDRAADNGTRSGPVCISRGIPVTVCRPVAIRAAPVAHRGRVIADHRATGRTPIDPVLIAIVDALRRWQVACACIPEAGITEAAATAVLGIGRT